MTVCRPAARLDAMRLPHLQAPTVHAAERRVLEVRREGACDVVTVEASLPVAIEARGGPRGAGAILTQSSQATS